LGLQHKPCTLVLTPNTILRGSIAFLPLSPLPTFLGERLSRDIPPPFYSPFFADRYIHPKSLRPLPKIHPTRLHPRQDRNYFLPLLPFFRPLADGMRSFVRSSSALSTIFCPAMIFFKRAAVRFCFLRRPFCQKISQSRENTSLILFLFVFFFPFLWYVDPTWHFPIWFSIKDLYLPLGSTSFLSGALFFHFFFSDDFSIKGTGPYLPPRPFPPIRRLRLHLTAFLYPVLKMTSHLSAVTFDPRFPSMGPDVCTNPTVFFSSYVCWFCPAPF